MQMEEERAVLFVHACGIVKPSKTAARAIDETAIRCSTKEQGDEPAR